jgi:eukaryotic-like serine/threonine-protein kinase
MQRVWPRCPKCGRRWQALHPACGTEVAPAPASVPAEIGDMTTPPETPAPLPEIAGLVMERLLGRGGFGEVLLAKRLSDGRRVAVKIPKDDPDAIMRLELEGETLRQLGGIHAPALYDTPQLADGRPCLVMEFVPLPILADRLGEVENGMPIDEIGRRGLSLLKALEAVHALDLVHRDLKPENVFSGDLPPVTRIFDFGLVKPPAGVPQQDTTVGTFMGTPEYMAPEQLDSSAPVDQRADIYAIGAVFYEMLAGRPPFWGNAAEVQQALANRRASRPSRYVPSAPRALEDVILRCLAKDPVRRFASTTELTAAFQAALAEAHEGPAPALLPAPTSSAPPPDPKASAAPARRPMAVLAVHGITVDVLMKALSSAGGHLVEVGRGGGVGLFTDKASENPVTRAIRMADGLLARKACRAAIVELTGIAVRKKPDGSDRYVSAAFAKLQKQLETMADDGLYLTAAAAELAPERRGQAAGHTGLVAALPPPREDDALTVVRAAQAPIYGRAVEMKQLVGSLRAAVSEKRAGLATIMADGGLGKSHICAALVEEGNRAVRDANVVELRAREPIEGDGDGNLRALLGRCFTIPAEKPADRGEALLGELGPALWPAAALTLGWMTPDEPELRTLAAAPGVLRATVSRSVGQALRRRARDRPMAVILDDAHYADDAMLEALEYATMPEAEVPLWICVAARPTFAQMKPSWGERSAAHLRLELGPLATPAATDLARRLLFPLEHIPAAALDTLVAGTHGNPFLLSELIRGLKRDGIVRPDPKTGIHFLATDELARLPDLAVTDWLAEREIGALPPELAAHARLCALLGIDFAEDEVEGVLSELERNPAAGQTDADLRLDPHVATRQLVGMGIFKRQRGGRAAFRHALLRAAVEKSASDRFRTEVHAAAFRFYRTARIEDGVRLARLALHAAGAGYRSEAAPVYLELADRARQHHRYVEAESLYTRALGQLEESDLRRRMIALRGRALMRYRMSRHDAVDDLTVALAAARTLGDKEGEVELVMETATAYEWMAEYHRSRDLVSEATTLLENHDVRNDFLRASLLVGQGRALWRSNEPEGAIEKLRQAIAMADPLGDQAYEIRVISLLLLGDLLPFRGQVAEAEQVFEAVLSLCEQHGDQIHLMAAYLNRRQLWLGRRNLERALDDTRRGIQIAREIGLVQASFGGEYNLGELLYQAGDPDAAWAHVRRAVELEEKRLSGYSRPAARLLEARVLAYLGRDQEARRVLAAIAASQAEAERTGNAEGLLLPSEQVLLRLVDLCTKEATDTEWKDLEARARSASVEQEPIEIAEMTALALGRRGQVDRARRMLDEALALAEKIPNVMERRLRQTQARWQANGSLSRAG